MIEDINKDLNNLLPQLIDFRQLIHKNPELSNKEYKTSKLIYDTLLENDIKPSYINEGIGVTALIQGKEGGPTVAYRADMDALAIEENTDLSFKSSVPNCMHACGHDIHITVLLGTALILNKLRDKLKGNIRLIFQSGEENFTGARQAIESGVLDNPKVDCILAIHTWPDLPAGTIGLKRGCMMASSSNVNFEVVGQGGHAAHPHKCIDPIITASYILTSIQSIISRNVPPLDSAVITFGKFIAGTASNIIPNSAYVEGTVRTTSDKLDKLIEEKITNIITKQAEGFGATSTVNYKKICSTVTNNDTVVDLLENSTKSSIGNQNLHWLSNPSMGSEDFSLYLEKVPGALIRLGTSNQSDSSKLALHNSKIIFDENSIETGVRFMTNAIINILNNF